MIEFRTVFRRNTAVSDASPFPIPLLGHREAFELLRGTVARGRLAHAYLFVGPPGIGKKRFAFAIAQCLLCDARSENELQACGQCAGCKQVQARSHPDLLYVECPKGKSELPVELLLGSRENRGKEGLLHDLSLRPMAGGLRIAIVDNANLLNDAGANALLKTLEEPPPQSLLILVVPSTDSQLSTIRSRCQVLRFFPLTQADVATLLLEQGLTESPDEAVEVAALSQGSLETAAQLLDTGLREHRQQLYDGLAAQPFHAPRLASRVNEIVEAAGSERSQKVRVASWLMQFCVEFYRQALLHLSGGTASSDGHQPAATSGIPQVQKFAARFPEPRPEVLEMTADLLERCYLAESQLESNVAIPLCLENLFEDLGRIAARV